MLTDMQILRKCRRILAREGLSVARHRGGYLVYNAHEPKEEGRFLWCLEQVIDLAEHRQEVQDEYIREQQQAEREIRNERRAMQRAMRA